ncbi:hypothetical protein GGI23_007867, partial [Coemansia sp. RSA 2559]
MSEEGEADFDAGQISDEQPTFSKEAADEGGHRGRHTVPPGGRVTSPGAEVLSSAPSGGVDGAVADTRSVHSSEGRRGEHDLRYARERGRSTAARSPSSRWGQNHSESEGHRHRRDERSRSTGRSRGYEYARRSGDQDPASHGGASPRRGTYRDDEGDYRRSGSYRPTGGGRYGDRDYGRPGYSRQYERESTPRYRRRDSERQPYARAPGYSSRDEAADEFGDRRDVDKDRAIEELRSRVRGVRPSSRERS